MDAKSGTSDPQRAPLVFRALQAQSRAHLQCKVGAQLPTRRGASPLCQAPSILGLVVLLVIPQKTGDSEGGLRAEAMAGLCRQIYVQVRHLRIINVTAALLDKWHLGLGRVSLEGVGGTEKAGL